MEDLNYQMGQKFLDMFTNENIFEGIKKIIKNYIHNSNDIENLNKCNTYRLEILNGKIERLTFYFGEGKKLYFLEVSPDGFLFEKGDGRVLIDTNTHAMIEVWNKLNN